MTTGSVRPQTTAADDGHRRRRVALRAYRYQNREDAGLARHDHRPRVRVLIQQAELDVVETVAWHKPSNPSRVPTGVFNASLSVRTRRAIDLDEGDDLDDDAFNGLVTAAAEHNASEDHGQRMDGGEEEREHVPR